MATVQEQEDTLVIDEHPDGQRLEISEVKNDPGAVAMMKMICVCHNKTLASWGLPQDVAVTLRDSLDNILDDE